MSRAQRKRSPCRSIQPSAVAARLGRESYRAAVRAASEGDFVEAKRRYEACLSQEPDHLEARHDLGVLALRAGRDVEAIGHFQEVVARQPAHGLAWTNLALALCHRDMLTAAHGAAERAVTLAPRSAAAHAAAGHVFLRQGKIDEAEAAYGASLMIDPSAVSVLAAYAGLLRCAGRSHESLALCDRRIALQPRSLMAHVDRLCLLIELRRDSDAGAARRAISTLATSDDGNLESVRALCSTFCDQHRAGDALTFIETLVTCHPGQVRYRAHRADILHRLGRHGDALEQWKAALALDPTSVPVLFGIGCFFESFGQPSAAAPFFLQTIYIDPDHIEARIHLAAAKLAVNDASGAIPLLRHALAKFPERYDLTSQLCWCRMSACDWSGLDDDFHRCLADHIAAAEPYPPFGLFAFGLPNGMFALWTRAWAERNVGPETEPLTAYVTYEMPSERRPVRIGYLSADFCGHATAALITELFESHDRKRFEIYGYNIGSLDSSDLGERMTASVDHFVDLKMMNDRHAAERIAADEIDILLDLKGFTKDSRPRILSYRPAPIQVNYMGYPASMGTPLVDYIIADPIVIPEDQWRFYSENVVYLPGCYQPNDRQRPGADATQRREWHGLPTSGFVFCCFNNNYKMTPYIFDIWMRLLSAVPGSVLWLLKTDSQIEVTLRREAQQRGITPDRLVFAERVALVEHIGRLGLADLFLDTLPVNAHTTASEALWAGLPVLTCLGPHFVGRVAASLLTAIGLPELITTSFDDYEREALELARDPARLSALRDRLVANRLTASLFDTPRYVRNYEAALERMVEMRRAGLAPEPFSIPHDPAQQAHDGKSHCVHDGCDAASDERGIATIKRATSDAAHLNIVSTSQID